jgi:predicted AAA+ superfamily ATPase
MNTLFEFSRKRIDEVPTDFIRYMYDRIKWQGRMLGLVGPRGVGKTTLLLQYARQQLDPADTLYISTDQLYFASHSLLEVADRFNKAGGKHLLIDEIHKYPDWSRVLKELYDRYGDMQVIFTGSSILDIYRGSADLSRRAPIYQMQGLSFREYLKMFHEVEAPVYSIDDILHHRATIPGIAHPIQYFQQYLRDGYYPFSRDVDYGMELEQIVTQTLETDIPQYAQVHVSVGRKLKQLLAVIARSVPFKPQMTSLANATQISRNDVPDYLYYMERAGMIGLLRDDTGGVRGLGKVEKVYIDNPNLMYVLAEQTPDTGNLRETFFYNQMRVNNEVRASRASDFTIGDHTFEIGGRKKGQKQIEDLQGGIVVKDDIEYGFLNTVPLWAFGLNY